MSSSNDTSTDTSSGAIYLYDPSIIAAAVFLVFYVATSALHAFQLIRVGAKFMIPFVLCTSFEAIGYIGRAVSCQQTPNWTLGPYAVQTVFILIAPALLCVSLYLWLGHLITGLDGQQFALIKIRTFDKISVGIEMLAFFVEIIGASMYASNNVSVMEAGTFMVIAGLAIQMLNFIFFLVVAGTFHNRMRRSSQTRESLDTTTRWKRHMYLIYFSGLLLICRHFVRIMQFLAGPQGYFNTQEYFIDLADGFLVAEVVLLYNGWHPARFIKSLGFFSDNEASQSTVELQVQTTKSANS